MILKECHQEGIQRALSRGCFMSKTKAHKAE